MILRRFTKHVTDQNWFAVALDIIVVVIGIFLGMQVTDWNNQRLFKVQEDKYMQRLHTDLIESYKISNVGLKRLQMGKKNISQVLDNFNRNDDITLLNSKHCYSVFASHVLVNRMVMLPTMIELLSSGKLDLIKSESIKLALLQLKITDDALAGLLENITGSNLLLSRKYPELIQLDRRMRNIDYQNEFEHQCNFKAMKDSISFNNDLIDNNSRLLAFTVLTKNYFDSLELLHRELDLELGLSHELSERGE